MSCNVCCASHGAKNTTFRTLGQKQERRHAQLVSQEWQHNILNLLHFISVEVMRWIVFITCVSAEQCHTV